MYAFCDARLFDLVFLLGRMGWSRPDLYFRCHRLNAAYLGQRVGKRPFPLHKTVDSTGLVDSELRILRRVRFCSQKIAAEIAEIVGLQVRPSVGGIPNF